MYRSAEDTLIASVVGQNAFYVYNADKLSLVFMSKFIAEEIVWIQAAPNGLIYTALAESNQIVAWNKMHRVASYGGHTTAVLEFIVAGDLLFSLAEDGEFFVTNMTDKKSGDAGKVIKTIKLDKSLERMIHPITYVNKLLFYGGKKAELWNIIEGAQIYSFTFESEVEVVEQSPVIDVVVFGCQNGDIVLKNLLYDQTLFTFK